VSIGKLANSNAALAALTVRKPILSSAISKPNCPMPSSMTPGRSRRSMRALPRRAHRNGSRHAIASK